MGFHRNSSHPSRPYGRLIGGLVCLMSTCIFMGSAVYSQSSLQDLDLSLPSPHVVHPSPTRWEDQVIYNIMIDRFDDGDSRNNCINLNELIGVETDEYHGCNPYSPLHFHGGDLRGVINRLDYLKNLGITTLMLTPFQRTYGLYHGYGIWNFLAVDPAFGTLSDVKELVNKAHDRGMYVILDAVINHSADVWEYQHPVPKEPPFSCRFGDESSRLPVAGWTGNMLVPEELRDFDLFNRCGKIAHWDYDFETENGDFFRLKDLATWKPEVAAILSTIYKWWIREIDVDGLRIDAIKHVDPRFLSRFNTEIREYAHRLGKTNFYLVGEAVTTRHDLLKKYLGPNLPMPDGKTPTPAVPYAGVDGLYDTATYYDGIGSLKANSQGKASMERLADLDHRSLEVFQEFASRNIRYLENLDTDRFLNGQAEIPHMKPAWVWLMTTQGIPMIPYGAEQQLLHLAISRDPATGREWDSAKVGPGIGARADQFQHGRFHHEEDQHRRGFSQETESFRTLQSLINLRQKAPVLRQGALIPLYADDKGIYAYMRRWQDQEVLVILNAGDSPWSGEVGQTRAGNGERFWVDALANDYRITSEIRDTRETWKISVPSLSARVMIVKSMD